MVGNLEVLLSQTLGWQCVHLSIMVKTVQTNNAEKVKQTGYHCAKKEPEIRADDGCSWWERTNRARGFQVQNLYSFLIPAWPGMFLWHSVSKARVSSRVAFFVWTAVLDKILTANNLRYRNFVLVSRYFTCKVSTESVDHVNFHSKTLGHDYELVRPSSGDAIVLLWVIWMLTQGRGAAIPYCLLWCIWRKWNARVFDDRERSLSEIPLIFFGGLREWVFASERLSFSYISDISHGCSFV